MSLAGSPGKIRIKKKTMVATPKSTGMLARRRPMMKRPMPSPQNGKRRASRPGRSPLASLVAEPDVVGPGVDPLHVKGHILHPCRGSLQPGLVIDGDQQRVLHGEHLGLEVMHLALRRIGRRLAQRELVVEHVVVVER